MARPKLRLSYVPAWGERCRVDGCSTVGEAAEEMGSTEAQRQEEISGHDLDSHLLGTAAYAVGYGGHFRLAFIKKGSLHHSVLGRINLAFHCLAVGIAFALPPLTAFSGRPLLAYSAAAFVVVSAAVGRHRRSSCRTRAAISQVRRCEVAHPSDHVTGSCDYFGAIFIYRLQSLSYFTQSRGDMFRWRAFRRFSLSSSSRLVVCSVSWTAG